jgi:hypothetical protein
MRITAFSQKLVASLFVLTALESSAWAQFIGAGSTPQGDYLRGVGIAAMGMGIYNERTAIANSINIDTAIRWDQYVGAVAEVMQRKYIARREFLSARNKEMDQKILDRLRQSPEARDVLTGDALSTVMDQLMDPKVSESSFRFAEVPLSVDIVRRIPFRLGESAETFSMNRLTLKGKGKWPVAFQDPAFAKEVRWFEKKVDAALDEAVEGRARLSSIKEIQVAVEELARKLDQTVDAKDDQQAYAEAAWRLSELRKTARLFETQKVQQAIGEIDKYAGTTVNDLRLFMRKYNLRFGRADTPDERLLYPELYETLRKQREKFAELETSPAK